MRKEMARLLTSHHDLRVLYVTPERLAKSKLATGHIDSLSDGLKRS